MLDKRAIYATNMTQKDTLSSHCVGCLTCQEWAQLVLDQEASEAQIDYVREHLAGCSDCAHCFDTDKALRDMVRCKCGKELPINLLEQIREKIQHLYA